MLSDVDLWEMAKICGKWLKYLTNGLINREMTWRFGTYMGHGKMALIYGHGTSI